MRKIGIICKKDYQTLKNKKIVSRIIDEGDPIFQSQLVDRSGYSRIKASLILDCLEAKKILEHKSHGMSKAIVLKEKVYPASF